MPAPTSLPIASGSRISSIPQRKNFGSQSRWGLVSEEKTLSNGKWMELTRALQKQVSEDLKSTWGKDAEHLSVYQAFAELRKREAFEEKLDGAPEATGEPGKPCAGELGRLAVRVFFSAGAGLLAWSHMPVETAQ